MTIVGPDNNYGLSREKKILSDVFSRAGIPFRSSCPGVKDPIRTPVVVFLEVVDGWFVRDSAAHFVFPDAEWWFPKWDYLLKRKDFFILAKTKHAEEMFRGLGANVRYTGFTSTDRLIPLSKKNRAFLHITGKSMMRGTVPIVKLWTRRPDFPKLTITVDPRVQQERRYPSLPNLQIIAARVSDEHLRTMQNECRFYLCPSEYEGFGHCIWEAKSCGTIPITTDAPPMNEAVRPEFGVLAEPAWKGRLRYAPLNAVSDTTLEKAVEKALAMSDQELERHSTFARDSFSANDRRWTRLVTDIFSAARPDEAR